MGRYSSPSTDTEDFWKVEADDKDFWGAYVSTRPNYSPPFYDIIYKYHALHSPCHELAHDVGCGAGQVTAELAHHYDHVVASDTDADHLTVAKDRLSEHFDSSRVSYTHAKAEDLAIHHPVGSADLIGTAEAVVLMDRDSGLRNFAKVLKPGGTLAAWFYGRPTFSDSELFSKGQPVLDKIMVLNWKKVIQGSASKRAWGFKRCADAMESWLDFLPFDEEVWMDVERYKWNTHGTLPFFGKEACEYEIEPISNVKEREKQVSIRDTLFWSNSWDVGALKKYFTVLFPGFREAIGDGDAEIDKLFQDLAGIMGGENAANPQGPDQAKPKKIIMTPSMELTGGDGSGSFVGRRARGRCGNVMVGGEGGSHDCAMSGGAGSKVDLTLGGDEDFGGGGKSNCGGSDDERDSDEERDI
ncbi:MAG: hypothetical protein Q9220_000362 [cf. Caloplaca sp. 1 TL-2023]